MAGVSAGSAVHGESYGALGETYAGGRFSAVENGRGLFLEMGAADAGLMESAAQRDPWSIYCGLLGIRRRGIVLIVRGCDVAIPDRCTSGMPVYCECGRWEYAFGAWERARPRLYISRVHYHLVGGSRSRGPDGF